MYFFMAKKESNMPREIGHQLRSAKGGLYNECLLRPIFLCLCQKCSTQEWGMRMFKFCFSLFFVEYILGLLTKFSRPPPNNQIWHGLARGLSSRLDIDEYLLFYRNSCSWSLTSFYHVCCFSKVPFGVSCAKRGSEKGGFVTLSWSAKTSRGANDVRNEIRAATEKAEREQKFGRHDSHFSQRNVSSSFDGPATNCELLELSFDAGVQSQGSKRCAMCVCFVI